MESKNKSIITVQAEINSPIEKVWKCWTKPEDIVNWNFASPEWCCPYAENDLRAGGKFSYRMEAKDGSMGFDFWGINDKILPTQEIEYTMGDGRKARILFSTTEGKTKVVETFEAESTNSIELQRGGWQAILDNFKKHCEGK
ncbi:MAG: SRPBCC family protein [Bacteroidales bacterium]|nr:SRPBCC family protein [Bacteroidales bacterium]MCF8455500.1 SRPBCC family protein [Bacteroidales bacterium]